MLYKVSGNEIKSINETRLPGEDITEEQLESWIERNPEILGEPLLIIGRQVQVADVQDKLDLLAIDKNGSLVIIELKRDRIGGDVDFQSLRYASYISRWSYPEIEKQAKVYFEKRLKETDFILEDKLEEFCNEGYDLNEGQRVVIVGRKIDSKIGSVTLWLLEQGIDVKVIELKPYKDNGSIYLQPQIIIPAPTTEKFELGKQSIKSDEPWISDGKTWHLQERCGNTIMSQKLLDIIDVISSISGIEGPNWNQKFYVSFSVNNLIWIWINTHRKVLTLWIDVKPDKFDEEDLAKNMGISIFDKNATLSEKLQRNSAVGIYKRYEEKGFDRIRLVIKEDFDVNNIEFKNFLESAFENRV